MTQVTQQQIEDFLSPWAEAWNGFTEQRKAGDAWPWVRACMRTRDEMRAVRGLPGEQLPVPDLPHLRVVTWAWYACPRLQIDKARQMMLTWIGCGLIVHAALFTPSAREGYQNMTMADTGEKLDRYMKYILVNQPLELMLPWVEERGHPPEEWVQMISGEFRLSTQPPQEPRADQPPSFGSDAYNLAKQLTNRYKTSSGPEGLELLYLYPFFDPTERLIEGIPAGPKGPNKWRGGTRTGANHDEAWFQQSLADNLNSASKSVGDYGYHRIWTTASLGEDGDAYPLKAVKANKVQPSAFGGHAGTTTKTPSDMPYGVEMWQTEMGYTHLRIHHYADPTKRGEAWVKRNVETGDRRKNMREVLIHYNTPGGNPFYGTFNHQRQNLTRPDSSDGAQLYLFADGGRRPAMGAALVYPNGRVHCVMEAVTEADKSSNVHTRAIEFRGMLNRHPLTRELWRGAVMVCDPSMMDTRSETDDRTSADVLMEMGFMPVKGSQAADTRYQAVTNLNLQSVEEDGLPALQIDPATCPMLYEAMSGACVVTKNAEKTGQNIKEKNAFSHITEALEYLATYLDANPVLEGGLDDLMLTVHRSTRQTRG